MQSTKPEFKRDNKTGRPDVSWHFAVGSIYFVARCGGKAWYKKDIRQSSEGGKFLKKLSGAASVGSIYIKGNLVLSTGLIM